MFGVTTKKKMREEWQIGVVEFENLDADFTSSLDFFLYFYKRG